MLGSGEGASVLIPLEIIVVHRVRRQQAEELEIVMEEAKEVEAPLPPRHHRTGVGEEAPEVEDRAEREEEE